MKYSRNRIIEKSALVDRLVRTWSNISNKGFVDQYPRIYSYGYQTRVERREDGITWDGNGRAYWHQCVSDKAFERMRLPSIEWSYNEGYLDHSFPGWKTWPDGYKRYDELVGEVYLQRLPSGTPGGWFDIPSDSAYKPADPTVDPSYLSQLDWGTAYEAVMNDAAGLMPSDISVGVNIVEFASLKRLVPGIAGSIKRILNYVKGNPNKTVRRYRYLFDKKTGKRIPWTATLETVKLRSLSWSLRDLASLNLGFSFGVLPLADDVGNWAQKLYQVQAHLNWYRTLIDGKSHWLRARTNPVSSYRRTARSYSSDRIGGHATWEAGIQTSLVGILHQRVRVVAKPQHAQYNAVLAQVLGMNVPVQLAWDLVPFSFVVDWFLPVGKLISRIEPNRALGSLSKRVILEDTWYSLQGEEKYLARLTAYEGDTSERDYRLIDPGLTEKGKTFYRRLRGSPAYNLLPFGKVRYGGKQFLLSLSLLAQRLISRR